MRVKVCAGAVEAQHVLTAEAGSSGAASQRGVTGARSGRLKGKLPV